MSESNSLVFSVEFEGKTYELDLADGDTTGVEARDFRRATGVALRQGLAAMASGELDEMEYAAGIVWLLQRREDKKADYEDILGRFDLSVRATLKFEEEAENPPG